MGLQSENSQEQLTGLLKGQRDPPKPQNWGWDFPSSSTGILLFMMSKGITQNSPAHLPSYLLAH